MCNYLSLSLAQFAGNRHFLPGATGFFPSVIPHLQVSHILVPQFLQHICCQGRTQATCAVDNSTLLRVHIPFVILRLGISPELEHTTSDMLRSRNSAITPAFTDVTYINDDGLALFEFALHVLHRKPLNAGACIRNHIVY